MQHIFAISGFINFLGFFLIGLFVLLKDRKNILNIVFFFLTLSASLWSFGYWRWLSEYNSYDNAIFWLRFLTMCSIWIPIFLIHWINLLLKKLINIKIKIGRVILILSYLLGILFSIFNLTPLLVESARQKIYFVFWPNPGILYHFYLILCYIGISIYTGIMLVKYYNITSGYIKNQIKYVIIGSFIALVGGGFNFFLWYDIFIPPYGNFIILIYPFVFMYAMIKYRLMDIRLVISKSILYFLLIGSVATAFTSITFFAADLFNNPSTSSQSITTLAVSIIIVIGLDPLKRFLSNITDKIFYRGKIDYQNVLRKLSEITAKEINLEKLFIDLTQNIEKLLKYKGVDFLYKSNSSGIYRGIINNTEIITNNEEIIKYLENTKEIVITEELEVKAREKDNEEKKYLLSMVKRLKKMNIGLIAPIISENRIISFLIIGKKMSDDVFSSQDLNLMSVIVPQIANALEKAKLYNEVQEFNVKLQEKVDQATENLKLANINLETRNKYLIALQKISNTISRSLDFTEVAQFIVNSIRSELGFVAGIIDFIDQDDQSIYIGAMTRDKIIDKTISLLPKDPLDYKVSLKEIGNLSVQAINNGQILKTDKLFNLLRPAIGSKLSAVIQKILRIKSIVSIPVYSENKIIGAIDFFLRKQLSEIKGIDIEVMKSLADQTGLVIGNLKLYQELNKKNIQLEDANAHLKKLDQAKSEFLSIASHQLRTPLTGIKGYLSMMLEGDYGKFDKRQKDIIKDVFTASDRMTRLVSVFLNVSRIESGRLKLDKVLIDIKDLVLDTIKDLKSSATKKGLKLTFEDSRSTAKKMHQIEVDPDKLKDVLLNLIDNSIKYTAKGIIKISLENDSKNIIFKIKDNGVGLGKDEVKKLFNKFSRGNDIAKIDTTGSGLGLYIARKIIEAHGGRIWVESDGLGKGSTFQFTLPLNK